MGNDIITLLYTGKGKYRNGTNQKDITLLWNFIDICRNYGGYEGTNY